MEASPWGLKARLSHLGGLPAAPACRHLAHSLFSHCSVLCPLRLLSVVWEETYESFTLQCELAHQTPGDPGGHSPIIAPAPWAGWRHHKCGEGPASAGGGGSWWADSCECARPCHGYCVPVVPLTNMWVSRLHQGGSSAPSSPEEFSPEWHRPLLPSSPFLRRAGRAVSGHWPRGRRAGVPQAEPPPRTSNNPGLPPSWAPGQVLWGRCLSWGKPRPTLLWSADDELGRLL